MGKDVQIVHVFAWGATLGHADKTTGEDNAIAILRFEDGRTATIEASWTAKGGIEVRNEIYCFVEAYRAGATPRETFEDGYVVNTIIDAAYRSMRSGRWESVETRSAVAAR